MTNFIRLTNNADAHKGNFIYINTDHITAVYEAAVDGSGIKTFVFGGHTGVQWEVEESPKQIVNLIMPVEYV
jgi:hypothetical protein